MFRAFAAAALLVLVPTAAFAEEEETELGNDWHRLVGMLQYLQGDYRGAVESKDEFELKEQREFVEEAIALAREMGPATTGFVPRLESLQQRVNAGLDVEGVTRETAQLVEDLVVAGGLSRSPSVAPDLEAAKKQYTTACASCHGEDGRANTDVAKTHTPRPTSFHDPVRMEGLTPYRAFNTVTFGITGTAMASFALMSERDRWALTFYTFTLRHPDCDHNPPKVSLEKLANSTDGQLAAEYGEKEVACLRRRIPKADEEDSLLLARNGVQAAMQLGAAGDAQGAKDKLLDAYLNGVEPVEALLRARNAGLVQKIEAGFMAARIAAENKSPHLQDEGRELLGLIDQARKTSGATDLFTVFIQAMLIILREGFEASVVVAALLAVLKKMNQLHYSRIVHLGWSSALVVGGVVYFFARHLIGGANREWMEGLVALAAVGMLLYAALWLNARSNTRKWMNKLRSEMQGAIGRGSAIGLFLIAFSAVGRESLETALFLQGLSIDSPQGALWGAVVGCVLLLGLVAMVNRVGYVLPMKTLFTASTIILFATAVVLLGKGLHALQEVGAVPVRPMPMFQLDFLGIYPDAVSLVPQVLLAIAPLVYGFIKRSRTPDAAGEEPAKAQ